MRETREEGEGDVRRACGGWPGGAGCVYRGEALGGWVTWWMTRWGVVGGWAGRRVG